MKFSRIPDKLVPFPSLFFIGKNGAPIEIVTGITKTVDELETKINGVLEKAGQNATATPATASANLIASMYSDYCWVFNSDWANFMSDFIYDQVNVQRKAKKLKLFAKMVSATNVPSRKRKKLQRRPHKPRLVRIKMLRLVRICRQLKNVYAEQRN